jgi:hypothetical protein
MTRRILKNGPLLQFIPYNQQQQSYRNSSLVLIQAFNVKSYKWCMHLCVYIYICMYVYVCVI